MRVVIACRVIQAELDEMREGNPDIQVICLDQSLHRTPLQRVALIQMTRVLAIVPVMAALWTGVSSRTANISRTNVRYRPNNDIELLDSSVRGDIFYVDCPKSDKRLFPLAIEKVPRTLTQQVVHYPGKVIGTRRL
jgi:hypothetical protein